MFYEKIILKNDTEIDCLDLSEEQITKILSEEENNIVQINVITALNFKTDEIFNEAIYSIIDAKEQNVFGRETTIFFSGKKEIIEEIYNFLKEKFPESEEIIDKNFLIEQVFGF